MQQTIPTIQASYSVQHTRAEAMAALKPWPSMGLFLLELIIIGLTLPADLETGPSCDDMIGETLLEIIRDRCLDAFYPGKPRPDPVAEGVCCRALGIGLERSRGNRCLCSTVEAIRWNGDSLAELCKLGDLTKQICGS